VIAGEGEQRLGQALVHGADEARGGAVRVPEVAEDGQAGASVVNRREVRRHGLEGEPFGAHVDVERRVIAGGDDHVEAWSISGHVLLDVREQRFVLRAPFVAGGSTVDGAAAVHLLEALRGAEVADTVPAQVAGVEHARAVAEPFEDCRRRRGERLARRGLVIGVHAHVRQAGEEGAEGGHGAGRCRHEAGHQDPRAAQLAHALGQPQGTIALGERPGVVALHDEQEHVARRVRGPWGDAQEVIVHRAVRRLIGEYH